MCTQKEIKSINDNEPNLAEPNSAYLCFDSLNETSNDIQTESELLDLVSMALENECPPENTLLDEPVIFL